MTESRWQLAQLNVGRLLAPVDSPGIAGFVAQLEPINKLADGHPAFVWRLQTDAGDATSIRPTEDDLFLINMSVWTSLEALRAFTYTTAHVQVLRDRRSWFERLATAHLVLWWVPAGHIPTVDEALDRLERLRRDGPTPAAFTFRSPFEPGAPAPANRWSAPSSAGRISPRPEVYRPGCQRGSATPRSWFSNRAITNSASDNRLR